MLQVITIDGPVACGKGTVARELAAKLGWRHLDSGALYRLLALASLEKDILPTDEKALVDLGASMKFSINGEKFYLEGRDVTQTIREESISWRSSQIAKLPMVRQSLLALQRDYVEKGPLVADGRDMGTVVFPEAMLKVYLFADIHCRARRRAAQLGVAYDSPEYEAIYANIRNRDEQDMQREVAPLMPAKEVNYLDSSDLTVDETVKKIMNWYRQLTK